MTALTLTLTLTLTITITITLATTTRALAATGNPGRDRELAEEAFKAGTQMRENGVFDPAVDLFYKALSLHKDKRYYVALGSALRDVSRKPLAFIAFRNALDMIDQTEKPQADPDYEGLVVEIVSMGLDLGKFDEVRNRLPALDAFNPELARSARNRLLLEQGKQALDAGQFPQAYQFFAQARKDTDDERPGRRGCVQALNGLADRLETNGRYRKALEVLLRLHRLEPTEDVAIRVQGAFIKAGKPADLATRVLKITTDGATPLH